MLRLIHFKGMVHSFLLSDWLSDMWLTKASYIVIVYIKLKGKGIKTYACLLASHSVKKHFILEKVYAK